MKIFICAVLLYCMIYYVKSYEDTYRAAVVEYAPKLTAAKALDRVQDNVREYLTFIEEAARKSAQIIVFPEDGLTGWQDVITDKNIVAEVSTEVPNPELKISPCTVKNVNYSKAFTDLSCAAKSNRIYVAVNLVEKRFDSTTNKIIHHNTNVVFDRNGCVIARYRKISLFNENLFEPGNETVSFQSDFGVKFGMFICADIMSKKPALDVLLDPEVTDIIFSVAWFSELPFLQGLSVHHGYTASTGVNMLSAGLNDPTLKNGGSGVYLAGGKIGTVYISGIKGSKLLVYDVPKINARKPSGICQNSNELFDDYATNDVVSFSTVEENMNNYTFKDLDLRKNSISETICSGETNFCCSFDIIVNSSSHQNYNYKLAIFHGARYISLTETSGIRNCAVVACLNESNTSCGRRHKQPPEGVTFEKLVVKSTFNLKDSHDQPATLNFNLKPVNNYTFCTKEIGNKVEVSVITTQKQSSLLTFGIHGRVFSNDNKPSGPINADS